jgi:TatD DNase family protein
MLIDTHCHIHEQYELPLDEVLQRAINADVQQYICVGTSEESSRLAVEYAKGHSNAYAAIGVHPHESDQGYQAIDELAASSSSIVAVGEIGLDYFYSHSPREVQIEALKSQLQTAVDNNLPVIFHVREAFDDFWPILDSFPAIRGVLHSFTDSAANMQKAIDRGLYIGVNGISTFTKDVSQLEMFDAIPLNALVFETDAPFLTPAPLRGKVNEPAYVRLVAEFHAHRRGLNLDDIAAVTTTNARTLFNLK